MGSRPEWAGFFLQRTPSTLKLNTWYRLTLRVDDVNGFKIEVRERDGGNASGSYNFQMPAGKTWRFHHWIYRNTAYLDNYVERTDTSRMTYYVGNHYEVSTPLTTTTKYYYFGAQRVAMQQGTNVYYLHNDHLGSTYLVTDQSISMSSRQTYYPFGAPRTTEGTSPTDYGFTGQKLDASDGLMYYGARYYDAALGRFISADTITPNLYNPQSLNRYAYVRNNPVRYTDPTGHRACGGAEDLDCDTPSGVGTPGECDLSCVEPPAVTQGEQNPSASANNPTGIVSIISVGFLGGFVDSYYARGEDFLFFPDRIVSYKWEATGPNGIITPQVGVSGKMGGAVGVYQPSDYENTFYVDGGSASITPLKVVGFGGDYFTSPNGNVQGFDLGPSVGFTLPANGEAHAISPTYSIDQTIEVNPALMNFIKVIVFGRIVY